MFYKYFRLPVNNPLQNITLIMEKDILLRELFSTKIWLSNDKNKKELRIPGNLTLETLPLNYKFYNCLIPIIDKLNEDIHLKELLKHQF